MGLQERFEKHWLGTVVLVAVVVAGGTWTVLSQVLVRPRDEELARLERRLEELDGKGRNTSPSPALKQGPLSAPNGEGGGAPRLQSSTTDNATPPPTKSPSSPVEPKANKPDPLVFSDGEFLRAAAVSAQRIGGRIVLTLSYENLSNSDYKIGVFNAIDGKDTMLIDNRGEKWDILYPWQGGASGPDGIVFLPHLPSKATITFQKSKGNSDITSFTLIHNAHIYPPEGPAHVAKVVIRDIPSSLGS